MALLNLGRHEEASTYYDQAIELNPQHERSWYNMGLTLSKSGEQREALLCFEEAEGLGCIAASDAIALCRPLVESH